MGKLQKRSKKHANRQRTRDESGFICVFWIRTELKLSFESCAWNQHLTKQPHQVCLLAAEGLSVGSNHRLCQMARSLFFPQALQLFELVQSFRKYTLLFLPLPLWYFLSYIIPKCHTLLITLLLTVSLSRLNIENPDRPQTLKHDNWRLCCVVEMSQLLSVLELTNFTYFPPLHEGKSFWMNQKKGSKLFTH